MMAKHPGGRPVTWTNKKIVDVKRQIDEYTEKTALPIVAEFCYTYDIRKQRLYEREEFSDSLKRLIEKKEAQLEKLALSGKAPPAMCIFSLKQLGWRDRHDFEVNANIKTDDQFRIVSPDGNPEED